MIDKIPFACNTAAMAKTSRTDQGMEVKTSYKTSVEEIIDPTTKIPCYCTQCSPNAVQRQRLQSVQPGIEVSAPLMVFSKTSCPIYLAPKSLDFASVARFHPSAGRRAT